MTGPSAGADRLDRWGAAHSAAMVAVALAVAGVSAVGSAAGWAIGGGAQVAVLAVAVAVLGLPHGAFDAVIGEELLRPRLGRWWGAGFSAGYLGLAAVVVGLWVVAPPVALASFFAAAAWHFGETDAAGVDSPGGWRRAVSEVVPRGVLPIAGPAAFHPAEVAGLLRWTMPGEQPWMTPGATLAAGAATLAVALYLMLPGLCVRFVDAEMDRRAGRRLTRAGRWRQAVAVAEVPALLALFAAAPPLVGFVVYFCGLHSVRHELHLVARVDSSDPAAGLRSVVVRALPATAVTVVGAAIAFAWLARSGDPSASAVRVVFVGLSALTVPHMALEAWASGGEGVSAGVRGAGVRGVPEARTASAVRVGTPSDPDTDR